jgi:hypothetical protein
VHAGGGVGDHGRHAVAATVAAVGFGDGAAAASEVRNGGSGGDGGSDDGEAVLDEAEVEVDMAEAEAGTLSSEAKAMPVPSLGLASHVENNDAASGGSRVVIKGLSPIESNDSSDVHKFVRSVRYVASARARVA